MKSKARNLILTKSQAACLIALRRRKDSKPEIAIQAKLDLTKTAAGLGALARIGLASQNQSKKWHPTTSGKVCRFKVVPDRQRRNSGLPGPGALRLLQLLDRPMRGSDIAEELGLSHQRVRQLVIKLHAQGRVSFGDPDKPFWIVMRAGDKTPLLSRDEEHVLSAIPLEYATDCPKIRLAARVPEHTVQQILERLVANRFVQTFEGLKRNQVYRITAAGLRHPQRDNSIRHAEAPRPPVESDRVRTVLSAIRDAGGLRIRDVTNMLGIQRQSINALMQYLKRKHLVEKTGRDLMRRIR
jgi:Mn-dependent DtxR family transcriptional regulator